MLTLREQFKSLNQEQRKAVCAADNTLVIAGPGSGKTRIIAVKAGLLNTQSKGVACLSYSNAAADQIAVELRKLHIYEGDDLFVGTVHSFCLMYILRPFLHLIDYDGLPLDFGIASVNFCEVTQESVKQQYGGFEGDYTFSSLRRTIIMYGEDVQISNNVRILRAYDDLLKQNKLVDFEMIVEHSVAILRKYEIVRSFLEYKFSWLLIDEYQDLGGGLHAIVLSLLDRTIKFLAVGDPNQLIYEFLGAKETYFDSLKSKGFRQIKTVTCYRFGSNLIRKTKLILAEKGQDLFYQPHNPEGEVGEINLHQVSGIKNHATYVVSDLLPMLLEHVNGDLSRIAILYRSRKKNSLDIIDYLENAFHNPELNSSQIEFHNEKNINLPDSPFVEWLCKCAAWASEINDIVMLNEFPVLFKYYLGIIRDAGYLLGVSDDFALESAFQQILHNYDVKNLTVQEWTSEISKQLNLVQLLQKSFIRTGDLVDLNTLMTGELSQRKMSELSLDMGSGKILITTMHKSKGREFDFVVLPGINNNTIPNRYDIESPSAMRACNRIFYVACTRAKRAVYIVHDPNSHYANLLANS